MNLSQCIRHGDSNGRDGYLIAFPYDEPTVEALKQIPHTEREWHPDEKTWWVSLVYEHILRQTFPNFEALVYLQGKLWG